MEKIVYLEKQDRVLPALPPEGEEARIDSAVRWINRKVANTVHFGMIQIGYYLLHNFFDGSIENALSKSPKKAQSFRRLCRRPDLVISSTHLGNAVKLVIQERHLAGEKRFASLPVSHKIALLGVENADTKLALAERTLDEGLSVRALNKEVKALKKGRGLPQQAWSRRLRRALQTVQKEVEAPEAADLSELGNRESEVLKNTVQEARAKLDGVLAKLPAEALAAVVGKKTKAIRKPTKVAPVEPETIEIQVLEDDAIEVEAAPVDATEAVVVSEEAAPAVTSDVDEVAGGARAEEGGSESDSDEGADADELSEKAG